MRDDSAVVFELIDLDSDNVVSDFANLTDALEAIRRVAEVHGWGSVANLSLMRVEGDDQYVVAMQHELTDLVASLGRPASAVR